MENKIQSVLSQIETQIKVDQSEFAKDYIPEPIDSQELKKRVSELNKQLKDANTILLTNVILSYQLDI